MARLALAGAVLALAACGGSTKPAALVPIGAGLRGAAGLHASVYARGIPQMSAFAFDASGRLFVARSGATAHGADGVYLVARAGAVPVKVVTAVRGPLGLVWDRGSLYVASLDGVDRFSGLTGTRFARRTRILAGPVRGAENNGLALAPDGRLVLAVAATCDHCSSSPRDSGAIVSFRRDGSGLRVLASHIRAAYGLLFHDGVLYASMNQRDDLGAKTPGDWIAVVRAGQDWGFPACYGQGGAACAGVPAPLGVLDAHAAAGGVAIRGDTVLTAEWEYGRVLQVPLGGGAATTFLAGFAHVLPLVSAPDGSLLAGDWGTGAIYRVTG